jgi:hypothetical protein
VGLDGDSVIEVRGAVTVTCVAALTVPIEAEMVVVPTVTELTMPVLPAELLMLTTPGEDEFHIADGSVPTLLP